MPTRIASMDLRVGHVPDDVVVSTEGGGGEQGRVAGVQPVVDFAQTFNGYAYGGAPHQLAPRVGEVFDRWDDGHGLPRDVDLLRACLFLWVRGRGHGGGDALTGEDVAWLNALLAQLRTVLSDRT